MKEGCMYDQHKCPKRNTIIVPFFFIIKSGQYLININKNNIKLWDMVNFQ